MQLNPSSGIRFNADRVWVFFLVCSSFLGMLLGYWVFRSDSSFYSSLMRTAVLCDVSIVSLLIVCVLPFVLSYFAFGFRKSWTCFFFSFLDSLLFSVSWFSVKTAFGSAGWLVCFLLLFSSGVCFVFLPVFLVHLLKFKNHPGRLCVCFTCAACVVCLVDGLFIAPFTRLVFDY